MLLDLMRSLTARFPQGGRRHHITINEATGGLELGVWVGDSLRNFQVDEDELRDPVGLIEAMERLIAGAP